MAHIIYLHSGRMPRQNASSIQVNHQCAGFAEAGYRVTLGAPILSDLNDYFAYYHTPQTYTVHPITRQDGFANGYRWGMKAALWAKQQNPTLVYTRDIPTAFFTTRLGLPTALELHQDLSPYSWPIRQMARVIACCRHTRWLITISGALEEYARMQLPIQSKKIIVAHDAAPHVSAKFIKPIKAIKNVGYVGNLYPGKGMETIVPLAAKHPELTFHIVGGWPEQIAQWQQQASENMVWHGHQKQAEAFKLLESFDVVLAPYSQKVAGGTPGDLAKWISPLKLFEYMAYGKPILCTDLPVLQEVVTDGADVLLCQPDDVADWSAKLSQLVQNPQQAQQLGITARQHYEQRHTYVHRAQTILAGLEQ